MKPKEIFERIRKKRKNLTELESREVLTHYGIPIVRGEIIKTIEDAKKFIDKIGYPVVLKIVSRSIIHKTEVGGVILDIRNQHQLEEAFGNIIKNVKKHQPNAEIDGIFIQEMVKDGYEIIVGGKRDPTFDSVVMVGMGGIFTELYEDVSFRVFPFTRDDVRSMLGELKSFKILTGYRGKPAGDLNALVDVIMKVGEMMDKEKEINELDMNPTFVLPNGIIVADARIIIE